jgi:hypothetical protein
MRYAPLSLLITLKEERKEPSHPSRYPPKDTSPIPPKPHSEGLSPSKKAPVKVIKRGVKDKKGRLRERGEALMEAAYKKVAKTSTGKSLRMPSQNSKLEKEEGAKRKKGQRKGKHQKCLQKAISRGVREEYHFLVR